MKLTFMFILLGLMSFASVTYSQSKRLTFESKDVTIENVFKQIEALSEFRFAYNSTKLDVDKKISLKVENQTVDAILDEIIGAANFKYQIVDRYIIITDDNLGVKNSTVEAQQSRTVTGKVSDTSGNPLPGVSVVVKGTSNGITTGNDGKYSLSNIPGNAVLQFSFVGMKKQEIPVGNNQSINVTLIEDAIDIGDVVVTALGIKRSERALGYSVQKVSGESLQKVSGVDVATSLTGKVAGLLVRNSSDFAVAPELYIRGEKPLLVIDGVAYANKTLSDISSEDIESMSVLKGATASALYGFRGASGAILVTTKNGSTNKAGITVDAATNTMFSAGFLAIPQRQGVYGRGNNNTYDKNVDGSWGAKMDGSIQNQWDPILKEYRDYAYLPVGKDNFKNFLEQGYITNNNVNIGYKGDKASLRSSVNWTQNKGQYPNSTLNKYTYTLGGDVNLDKFKLSSNVSYSLSKSPNVGSNSYTSYDPMYSLLIWTASDYNIKDYKNNYWLIPHQTQNFTYKSLENNPYYDRYERTNEVSRHIFNADMSMSYQLTDWMKASLRTGLDFYTDKGELRTAWGSYVYTGGTPVPGNSSTWNGYMTGNYNIGQNYGNSINSDFLLTGDKSFNKFKVEYLAGGTMFYKRDDNINAATNGGITVPDFFSLKASASAATVAQTSFAQQVNSVYGRLGLSYNNWAFIEGTGRNDWNSTLPTTTRSYFYPSVAASFVISELLPGSTKNWLDFLKLRASWTESKTAAQIYETTANSVFGIYPGTWNTLNGAGAPGSLYPKDIIPASAKTMEVGMQTMMFKNRLMVDVSYYDKLFQNAIISGPLTPASGYNNAFVNTKEEISRRGWEVTVNGSPIKTKEWQWDLGINWSAFARYYTKLDPTYSLKKPWVKVGERADAYVSREFLTEPATGQLIYNSSGRIQTSQYDSKFGNMDPDWIWGANSTLRYKDFSLFVSMDGVVGGLLNTRTESYMWQSGVHPESVTPERALDVATPGSKNYLGNGVKVVSGAVAYDPIGNITSDNRVYAPNDVKTTYRQAVLDLHGSSAWGGNGTRPDTYAKTFLKLREIALTYTVPTKYLHGYAQGATVGFVGQNVLLWAKAFKYSDPDAGGDKTIPGGSGNATGRVEDFSDPAVRYLGVNIKLTF